MSVLVEKSLMNCHCPGVDSLVIKDAPGMVRLFIARPEHELWRNWWRSEFSVAMHAHHCAVTLQPILGEISNLTFGDERHAVVPLKSFRYESPIRTGGPGRFTLFDGRAIPAAVSIQLMDRPLRMDASECHTVYVPQGRPAAWYVWEGAEDPTYSPIVYSNRDLTQFDFAGLDQPITAERLAEDLALIGVRP